MRSLLVSMKSRKFIMTLVAAAVAGMKVYYPDIPEEAIYTIAGVLMGYVAVEGAVDAAAQLSRRVMEKKNS